MLSLHSAYSMFLRAGTDCNDLYAATHRGDTSGSDFSDVLRVGTEVAALNGDNTGCGTGLSCIGLSDRGLNHPHKDLIG